MSNQALIFDIKRFALHDGPGIRTTIFLKGCPLHCVWCHNPEGISPLPDRLYTQKKCIGCQSCVEECPNQALVLTAEGIAQKGECTLCGRCAETCPTLAMEIAGKHWDMADVMTQVEKERKIMEDSGGGVTLCGGEPLLHPDYLLELLQELGHRKLHRTVDTTLFASRQNVERILPHCELLLIDLKHMDSHLHQQYTGVPNEQILENIRLVSQEGHPYWIRIPLIDGVNADEQNLQASAQFLSSLPTPPQVVNLLPYHDIGKGKHSRMGTAYNPDFLPMNPPTQAQQELAAAIFGKYGLKASL